MSRAQNLTEIWNLYTSQVLNEKTSKKSKEGPGPVELNDPNAGKLAEKEKTGPDGVKGLVKPTEAGHIGARPSVKKTKVKESTKKITKTAINNSMKSTFDKLFEEVMGDESQDLAALGVDVGGADDAGGELDEFGGEEVTVTLTSDQVECLRAILAQLDGEDEMDAGLEDVPADDEGLDTETEEDNQEKAKKDEEDAEEGKDGADQVKEATDLKEVPASAGQSLTKVGNNKVGDKTSKLAKSSKADGKVNATVDGKGKDVPDSAGEGLTKVANNKPNSKIKGGNQEFFGV